MREAGQRRQWNGRRGPGAADATRDGGGDLRYVSPAWAGRRGLEPGGVMRRNPIRAPGVVLKGRGGRRQKVRVASWSAHLALSFLRFPTLRADLRASFESSVLFFVSFSFFVKWGRWPISGEYVSKQAKSGKHSNREDKKKGAAWRSLRDVRGQVAV